MLRPGLLCAALLFFVFSCNTTKNSTSIKGKKSPEINASAKVFVRPVELGRDVFVSYAKTLLGTPYKYGSVNPANGLDCSGFVYHVFTHFSVKCPRSSKDYTNEGAEVSLKEALPGDIILFTGSNHRTGIVGHMGIVTENKKELKFIHAATSKSVGVIISSFEGYYRDHFVKLIRVLK